MDHWDYEKEVARTGKHPAYCTCVRCARARLGGRRRGGEQSRHPAFDMSVARSAPLSDGQRAEALRRGRTHQSGPRKAVVELLLTLVALAGMAVAVYVIWALVRAAQA